MERGGLTNNVKGFTLVSKRRHFSSSVTIRVYSIFPTFNRLLLRIVALRRVRELPIHSSERQPMSMQAVVINEDATLMEAAKTDSQPRRKWRLLASVAFLILMLIEVGGIVLLCYQGENPAPVPMLQGR